LTAQTVIDWRFFRHGDLVTVLMVAADPVYLMTAPSRSPVAPGSCLRVVVCGSHDWDGRGIDEGGPDVRDRVMVTTNVRRAPWIVRIEMP
jgi:hypothetical protein